MFQKCVSKSESRQPLDKNDDDVTDSYTSLHHTHPTHTALSELPPKNYLPQTTPHTQQILRQIYKIRYSVTDYNFNSITLRSLCLTLRPQHVTMVTYRR
jgi:hypothetical protein